jgi:hypothetical protein
VYNVTLTFGWEPCNPGMASQKRWKKWVSS